MRDLFVEGLSVRQFLEPSPHGVDQIESGWLFFPEIKTLSNQSTRLEKVREHQEGLIQNLIDDPAQNAQFPEQRFGIPEKITQDSIELTLEAKHPLALWREPVRLTFPYLQWEVDSLLIAWIPALEIEVPIRNAEKQEDLIRSHVEFALARREAQHSLYRLAQFQRCHKLETKRFQWNAYPRSPKERHQREENDGDSKQTDILKDVASRIDIKTSDRVYQRKGDLAQLSQTLRGKRGAGSVLVVGESGVGKTQIILNLASRKEKFQLGAIPFFQSSGSRIVAGMCGFGEWQERCRAIVKESQERGAILYLGNLLELTQVGQHAYSSESVASFFRPYLVRREFMVVAECTPAQLALIEQQDPRLLEAFRIVRIDPSTREESKVILEKTVGDGFTSGALLRLLKLHERYAGYSAFPGRMLRFARRLLIEKKANPIPNHTKKGGKLSESIVTRAFAKETGLPDFLLDDSIPLDLDETSQWFHERLMGQSEAVELVVDTIASIKTRLTRPGKPLASFLFIGPTGVGKTELAKTLAHYLYGSPDRLLRLDMSEYSMPGSASRLACGGRMEPEGILTSRMRDQPFSVLLLDEFEKAHDSVYDLFLQILGEARLTDGAGRLADFSNALIILTSNLGAAEFSGVTPGFHDPKDEDSSVRACVHFTEAVRKQVRPEFFNRIDRIVPFLPLDERSVRQILQREMEKAGLRDGFRSRELSLEIDESVSVELAHVGYDARYGARPLKRAINERILQPLARYLTSRHGIEAGTIEVSGFDPETGKPVFAFHSGEKGLSRRGRFQHEFDSTQIPKMRRLYQQLEDCSLCHELASEVSRLRNRLAHAKRNRRNLNKADSQDLKQLSAAEEVLQGLKNEALAITRAEENLLLDGLPSQLADGASLTQGPNPSQDTAVPGRRQLLDRITQIYQRVQNNPDRIVLVFLADKPNTMIKMAHCYRKTAAGLNLRCTVGWYPREPQETLQDPQNPLRWKPNILSKEKEADELLAGKAPRDMVAIALEIAGDTASLFFSTEGGLHLLIDENQSKQHAQILALTESSEETESGPTAFTIQQGYLDDSTLLSRNFQDLPLRRQWDRSTPPNIKDTLLPKGDPDPAYSIDRISPELSPESLSSLLHLGLEKRMMSLLE